MLLEGFLATAARRPEAIAFIAGERDLSYAEAACRVRQIAASITGPRVAIAMDRGIDAALAILGVLYAGAAYIPLDLKNPPPRLQFILADADVQSVIGQGPSPAWLERPERWLDCNGLGNNPPLATRQLSPADNIAAILYTSGSTGTPKGVALSHGAMANFAQWAFATFALSANDRIATLAPFSFDLSVFDLFAGLTAGACLHFVPTQLTLAPAKLTQWLAANAISIWYTVPSLLSFIALKGDLQNTALPALRALLFAGEVFPTPQLLSLSKLLPETALYNLYGPTETNVCCFWPVARERLQPEQAIPIGLPACGSKLQIDQDTGELLVDSANNCSGYWRQGQLIPLAERWYRTGDKVSQNARGELLYHGRLDRMLKCSGYRIEPAEIETAILALPGVEQCAVVGIADAASGQRPAAAVVLKADQDLGQITQAIRQQLPSYMQPGKYLQLSCLPYLTNGKIDYLSLIQQLR